MPAKTPKPAEDEKPAEGALTVDSLAADVAEETEPPEYLDGTPVLIPILSLPRMRRADAYEALGKIQSLQRKVKAKRGDTEDTEPELDENGDPKVTEIDTEIFGDQYRVVAYIEEYLAAVAANEQVFRAWAIGLDDADLVKTFNIYIRRTQPGEAESSTG